MSRPSRPPRGHARPLGFVEGGLDRGGAGGGPHAIKFSRGEMELYLRIDEQPLINSLIEISRTCSTEVSNRKKKMT